MNYYLINLIIQIVVALVCTTCAISACILCINVHRQSKRNEISDAAYLTSLAERREILSKRIKELEQMQAEFHKKYPANA